MHQRHQGGEQTLPLGCWRRPAAAGAAPLSTSPALAIHRRPRLAPAGSAAMAHTGGAPALLSLPEPVLECIAQLLAQADR